MKYILHNRIYFFPAPNLHRVNTNKYYEKHCYLYEENLSARPALCLALCVFGAGCVDNDEPSGGGGASSGEELDVKVGQLHHWNV